MRCPSGFFLWQLRHLESLHSLQYVQVLSSVLSFEVAVNVAMTCGACVANGTRTCAEKCHAHYADYALYHQVIGLHDTVIIFWSLVASDKQT